MLPTDIDELHKMVEDLRRENADRRVKGKAFDDAFADFNDQEQQYLLSLVKTTAGNPAEGAKGFRDLAFQMMQNDPEKFLDGLDIQLPAAPAVKEEEPTTDKLGASQEEAADMGLTKEEMQKILDERDNSASEKAAKAQQEKEIAEIYAEIEALGFEQGTEAFLSILNLAGAQASVGKDVDFAALAPKVRTLLDIPEPDAKPAADAEPDPAPAPEGSGKPHVSTADIGSVGGAPTEAKKDWLAEAKEKGLNPMEVARDRAEKRLSGELV